MIYLLHFDAPIAPGKHTTQHYCGYAGDLDERLRAHAAGCGARLTQVALSRGIGWRLVRTWDGDRFDERKLKRRKEGPRLALSATQRRTGRTPRASLMAGIAMIQCLFSCKGATYDHRTIRLEAEALVQNGDVAAAFAEAQAAVNAAFVQFKADREAAEQREREEWERQRQERVTKANTQALRQQQGPPDDESIF